MAKKVKKPEGLDQKAVVAQKKGAAETCGNDDCMMKDECKRFEKGAHNKFQSRKRKCECYIVS